MRFPSAVASTGPASTGTPRRVGGKLAEERVLRPSADDVDRPDGPAGQALGLLYGVPVLERQALEDAPRHRGGLFWRSLSRLLAEAPDARGHVSGCQERGMVGVDERTGGRRVFGEAGQLLV